MPGAVLVGSGVQSRHISFELLLYQGTSSLTWNEVEIEALFSTIFLKNKRRLSPPFVLQASLSA